MSAPAANYANHLLHGGHHTQQTNNHLMPPPSTADSHADSKQPSIEPGAVKAEPLPVKKEPDADKEESLQPSISRPVVQQHNNSQNGSALLGGHQEVGASSALQPSTSAPADSRPQAGPSQGGYSSLSEGEQGGSDVVGKQVSTGDIQRVQNYIEKCLQMYLSQKEVIMQLQQQFKIEPCFTQLVWQKLEEQNQEFFKAYYTRLKLKDQIILFNHLLDEQVKMFQRMPRSGQTMPGGMMMPAQPCAAPGYAQLPPNASQQSAMSGQLAQDSTEGSSFPMTSATEPEAHPSQLNADPTQLSVADFPGLGIDGGADLPPELTGMAQSLPFSGSEINLAGMVSMGSPGRALLGNSNDHVDLSGLPRNFSLSDLALDQVNEGDHGLPRNISLSDLPALDLDSGGEQT